MTKKLIRLLALFIAIQLLFLGVSAQKAELVIQTGHTDLASSVVFSPDGKTLASGSRDKTIKLWDIDTGRELKTLFGHTNSVHSIAYSPDGKTLASGSRDKTIKLWDMAIAGELRTLRGHTSGVSSVTFSPDGKSLASGSHDKTIKLWNISTGEELKTFKGHTAWITSVAFSPDGQTLASVGYGKTIKLWNSITGEKLKTFIGHTANVQIVTFSPDGKSLASGSHDKTIKLWDIDTGRVLKTFIGHTANVRIVTFSPNGRTLASGSYDKMIKLWDVNTGKELKNLSGNVGPVISVAFSPNGNLLASGNYQNTVNLWDVASGEELKTFNGNSFMVMAVTVSPDGKKFASGSYDGTIKLWDVASQKELMTLSGHKEWVMTVRFSPDGKLLASGSTDKTIRLWDVINGQEIRTLDGHNEPVHSISFSPDSKMLFSWDTGKAIKLWDTVSGKELKSVPKNGRNPNRAFLRKNKTVHGAGGKIQIRIGENGRLNLYAEENRKMLASLVALRKSDWAVVTPEGLFDASPNARKLMHYIIGLEPISLEQMKDVYYVPGLLHKIIKGEPLPKVELFRKKDLFPDVDLSQIRAGQSDLTIKLTNRGGGIGQVQILVNGKEFVDDARPDGFDPSTPKITLSVSLQDAPLVAGQQNKIEVVARNAEGSLSNRGTAKGSVEVRTREDDKELAPTNIYAIIGGVSDYTGDGLDLTFAAKDAEDFAKAIELGAAKLLGDQSKVHIRLLTSNGANSNVSFDVPDAKISTATKQDFERAFSEFSVATTSDVFIVYLSGHGTSVNLNTNPQKAGGDTYLYLTQEATSTNLDVLRVETARKAMTLSSDELKDLMKKNKALKQVLVLDTCAAGAAASSLTGQREMPSDQIRALERLKDNTGFFVLMGSAADKVSYEASQYGQGLLTYSLLQGMKGAKLRENQYADIGPLFDYALDRVPQMAKNIGGIQRPLIIAPEASASFDIGKFTQLEQSMIVLPNPKPVILRPTLVNPDEKRDDLKLTDLLETELRELSYSGTTRGATSPLVFVEADEMADAIIPSGLYRVEGERLTIEVVLNRNDQPLGGEIVVTGKVSEKEKLIKELVSKIADAAAKK